MKPYLIIRFLVIFTFLIFSFPLMAKAGASLSIFPQTGSFTVGSTFDVSVFLNTGGENVNAVKVDLKFDPEKLQVITPSKGLSAVTSWTFPPTFSNSKGMINLQGGFLPKGINISEGLVTVIVFEAISTGKIEINFLDSSLVLLADEKGTNILTSLNRAIYDILPSPLMGPKIFSETHPDQNKWYKNNSPTFSWEKMETVEGYSYKLDDDAYGEPDNTIDTTSTSVSFENIEDGVRYFHLKTKKEGVWGGTSHYKVMIDTTPPLKFKPYVEPFSLARGNSFLIYFNTSDLLSEIDHYEVRIADLTDSQHLTFSSWNRQESPFRFGTERSGNFRVLVRAFDKANNFSEETTDVRVFIPLFVIGNGGIQIFGLFLPWWLIFTIIAILLIIIGINLYSLFRRRNLAARLKKEVAEAEKEIDDVRRLEERIKEMRALEEEAKIEAQRLSDELKNEERDERKNYE